MQNDRSKSEVKKATKAEDKKVKDAEAKVAKEAKAKADEEAAEKKVNLRSMSSGEEQTLTFEEVLQFLKRL